MSVTLKINGKPEDWSTPIPSTPLLWVLRDHLGMTGTNVRLRDSSMRAARCMWTAWRHAPAGAAAKCGRCRHHHHRRTFADRHASAANGLGRDELPQCGLLPVGHADAAARCLQVNPQPTDEDINTAVDNICRCGTYPRIRAPSTKAPTRAGHKK